VNAFVVANKAISK